MMGRMLQSLLVYSAPPPRYGKLVGPAIKELITIVTPRTFARWLSGESRQIFHPPESHIKVASVYH
jgi:hypothetical protein